MERDGNGWAWCSRGHRHWGRHGAAGLLLHSVDDDGVVRVLMQHRAPWSHHGDTWGLPGGARDSHEDPVAAALREAAEETGLDRGLIRTRSVFVDDHGGWSYATVHADIPAPVATAANDESHALVWVPVPAVDGLALHPGFAETWPLVRVRPSVLLVDAANVIGTRPDGWWRDRAGAATRLLAGLAGLRATTVPGPGPGGRPRVIAAVAVVLEGGAEPAVDPGWVSVHRAGRGASGDDVLAEVAGDLLARDDDVLAVSADRGLRARWEALAGGTGKVQVVGPRWLLEVLDRTAPSGPRAGRGSMRP